MTRRVLVVPGGMNGPMVPTLAFPAEAAARRGGELVPLWWTRADPSVPAIADPADAPAFAEVDLARWFAEHGPSRPLVIGRSLGSFAAAHAARWGCPAIWMNPLLHREEVVAGLRAATAPALLVGGTADRSWNPGLARELSPRVHEVAEADHGLIVPGPLTASVTALAGVVAAVEDFLDEIWG
ncbi:hypothetical protein Afil01_52820 [Actinorhabdospora filicis]|uniref:Alpha/beta hydrolase n=1 Tax=Actinorhabdospora filicis TaxID=1785913 RepID=A0A9W6SR64_9ACTN|nr:alpha/beta hydrolase [Actinorhabdospora filicis]GLZ80475.1 hypothetical protein Afil01_52820 [Actinorhabdospora filicis]